MPSTKQLTRQAEALFVSSLQPSERPAPPQVRAAIVASLRTYRGASGCAARMAGEYGEHPEEAVNRMRWALSVVGKRTSATIDVAGQGMTHANAELHASVRP